MDQPEEQIIIEYRRPPEMLIPYKDLLAEARAGRYAVGYFEAWDIYRHVDIPLVIHGGTGFPEEAIPQALALGVAKFNIGTLLKQAFFDGVASAISDLPPAPSIQQVMGSRKETDILQQGKLRMRQAIVQRMRAWDPAQIGR
jgi:fructose/tagatose bisphosphate aldolase